MQTVELTQLRNFFDNATKYSYKRMYIAAKDHIDKLAALLSTDTTIKDIHTVLFPLYQSFKTLYEQINTNYLSYQADTQSVENLLKDLSSTHIRKWDAAMRYILDETNIEYTRLMGNGRANFQNGAYELRIGAVHSLLEGLFKLNNPALQDTANSVQDFLQKINTARANQQGTEQRDALLRKDLEEARTELAQAMHHAFFKLCVYYFPRLDRVETFYELKYFRANRASNEVENTENSGEETNFKTINLEADEVKIAATGDFDANSSFILKGDENTEIIVYMGDDVSMPVPSDFYTLLPNVETEVYGSELLSGMNKAKHLFFRNKSHTNTAKAQIK